MKWPGALGCLFLLGGAALAQETGLPPSRAAWWLARDEVKPIADLVNEAGPGKVKVYKLDVDANPKSASTYSVRSIPSILFFKGGSVVDTVIGAAPKSKLKEKFEQHA